MESNINEKHLINSENIIEGKSIIHALMPGCPVHSHFDKYQAKQLKRSARQYTNKNEIQKKNRKR